MGGSGHEAMMYVNLYRYVSLFDEKTNNDSNHHNHKLQLRELNLSMLTISDKNKPFNLTGRLNIVFALFTVSHCSDHFGGNRCQEFRLP